MLTKYHLVFESIESRMFFPGQLIMSVHERSPLCLQSQQFYKQDGQSKFRKEIDMKIAREMGGGGDPSNSLISGMMQALNTGKEEIEEVTRKRIMTRNSTLDNITVADKSGDVTDAEDTKQQTKKQSLEDRKKELQLQQR